MRCIELEDGPHWPSWPPPFPTSACCYEIFRPAELVVVSEVSPIEESGEQYTVVFASIVTETG